MKCEIQKSSVVAQHYIVASFGSCFAFFIFRDQFIAQQKHLLRLKKVVAKSTCTDLLGTAASCSRKEKDGKYRPKTCDEAMLCDIFRVFVSRISPPLWYETREFKQSTTAGPTTAAVTEKVWGEYVSVVC